MLLFLTMQQYKLLELVDSFTKEKHKKEEQEFQILENRVMIWIFPWSSLPLTYNVGIKNALDESSARIRRTFVISTSRN